MKHIIFCLIEGNIKQKIEKYGGWPVVSGESWNYGERESWDWIALNGKIFDDGFISEPFFILTTEPNAQDPSKYILTVTKIFRYFVEKK